MCVKFSISSKLRYCILIQNVDLMASVFHFQMDFHAAGLFEHVAKMSRLVDPQPPPITDPFASSAMGVPPIRYRPTLQRDSSLSSLSAPSSPLPWPEVTRPRSSRLGRVKKSEHPPSESDSERGPRKKHSKDTGVPVKLKMVSN